MLLATACTKTPTAPDVPELIFRDATAQEEALGWDLWAEQKACTGYDGTRTEGLIVRVRESAFLCGPTLAGGCTYGDRIEVARPYYEAALSHEYIHHAMRKLWLGDDLAHEHPLWAKCDKRNRGGAAVDHGVW